MYSTSNLLWSLSYPWKEGGVGPEKTQRLFSRLNRPEGMDVPGLIACGSMSQRSIQSDLRRCLAIRKLGAVALRSCVGSPVACHFRQWAAVLLKRLPALWGSLAVNGGAASGMSGASCLDGPWQTRT